MIKLMIGLLIIACIAPLFLKGPSGDPLMTLDDWKIDIPDEIKTFVAGITNSAKSSPNALPGEALQPRQVYKWQDDDGQWHFSNAPPNLEMAEEIEIADVNLMEAYVPPVGSDDATESFDAETMTMTPGIPQPAQVEEMMQTVGDFEQTMNERKAALDALSGQKN